MTYFQFLLLFLVVPIAVLMVAAGRDWRNGRLQPEWLRSYAPWQVIAAHMVIAVLYSTPWDNYLVATRVWWYDPALVTGLTIGWVPIEEYTFFLLQPVLTGLWLLYWMRRQPPPGQRTWTNHRLRRLSSAAGGLLWLGMAAILLAGWRPGTYLALELAWALPPIILQLYFGADILWRHRFLVLMGLLPTTLYLSAADALAIGSGTWTINPEQSLGWLLGGVLPVEEFLFFLITNVLIVFGTTLVLAAESQERLRWLATNLGNRWRRPALKGNGR